MNFECKNKDNVVGNHLFPFHNKIYLLLEQTILKKLYNISHDLNLKQDFILCYCNNNKCYYANNAIFYKKVSHPISYNYIIKLCMYH